MTAEAPDISIRFLTPGDYDAACELWRLAGLAVKLTGREAREAFAAQLERFPTTYLGAEDGRRLVGVILGTHDHRKGWINRLAVHPQYRRRGVGLALLQACERALRDCGLEIIAVFIEDGNEPSRRLLERGGYLADVPVHYYRKRYRPDI